ncbi:MAG: NAD(P)/FAD-dependent oxidoreductase [Planctomycetota bacterium]|nr:NAD(P)/FAD-dependent oxidoreductase [Planctomycetota bacterium]
MVVGEFTQETDLVVIGGGPGGYSAAFRAAELGLDVVIVDQRHALGGICLHEGCVPSKTLLHIADTIRAGQDATQFGVQFGAPKLDFNQMRDWNRQTIDKLATGLESLGKKNNVEFIQGRAYFEDSRILHILDGSIPRVRFKRALIASGTSPIAHPEIPFDEQRVLSPEQAVGLPTIPKTMLVIGSDYMAIEIACIYASLGSEVNLAFEADRLLPEADKDITRPLEQSLKHTLKAIRPKTTIEKQEAERYESVVVSKGRRANVESLRLEKTGVTLDDAGFIIIDDKMKTTDPRIHAVGDVTGPPLLANHAIHQGRACGEIVAGRASGMDATIFPMVVYSDPQVAWCGLTQLQAQAEGIEVGVVKIPWGASGLAMGIGKSKGVTKLIHDPDSKLVLGVGITGSGASEMIAEAILAIEMGAVVADLAITLHPHPTRSELLSDGAWKIDSADTK